MSPTPDRIHTQRHVDAMVALDTIDLIAARVRNLLSWNRRIALTHRYTHSDREPELTLGLTLDTEAYQGGIVQGANDGGKHFGVHLRPGLMVGFGFSAYPGDDCDTEKQVWQRYHAGKDATDVWARRRNMTRRVRPLLFDDTALIALFDAHQPVYRLWLNAEADGTVILIPAGCVFAANVRLRTTDGAWAAILGAERVAVLELTAGRALAASAYSWNVAVGHASVEARDVDATIVTARYGAYDPLLRVARF